MAKILVPLAAILVLAASGLEAAAQRTCPDGKVYDPDKDRCVTPRGSH